MFSLSCSLSLPVKPTVFIFSTEARSPSEPYRRPAVIGIGTGADPGIEPAVGLSDGLGRRTRTAREPATLLRHVG